MLVGAASCEVAGRVCQRRPGTTLTPIVELVFQASLVLAGSSTVSMNSLVARLCSSVQAALVLWFTGDH